MRTQAYNVSITPEEHELLLATAKSIYDRMVKVAKRNYTVHDEVVSWRKGLGGEVAMAKLFGASYELPSEKNFGLRHMGDVYGLEVKSTTVPRGKLMVSVNEPEKLGRAHALFVCTDDLMSYELKGWLYGHDVARLGQVEKMKTRDVYAVTQDKLRDPYELIERFCLWAEGRDLKFEILP